MRRTKTAMMASTNKMWMNPPIVYELTIPSNHNTMSITAMVQSIVNPFLGRASLLRIDWFRLVKTARCEYRVDSVSSNWSSLKLLGIKTHCRIEGAAPLYDQ